MVILAFVGGLGEVVQDGVAEGELLLDVGLFFGELTLELGVGHRTGILKLAEASIGETREEVAVGNDLFQGLAAPVSLAMLRIGKPTKEIVRTVVERIVDKVVAVAEIGFALAVDEGGTLAVEDFAHEDMAQARMIIP